MFCPKCHSLMFMKDGVYACSKCGYTALPDGTETHVKKTRKKEEAAVIEDDIKTLPVAKVECPVCHNHEAYWVLRQTRASDEPETRIYQCTNCGHKWREY